jgi:hypothetical protein
MICIIDISVDNSVSRLPVERLSAKDRIPHSLQVKQDVISYTWYDICSMNNNKQMYVL